MGKSVSAWPVVALVALFLVGILATIALMPEKTVTVEVEKEVNNTVEVEVIKEVPVNVTVFVDSNQVWLDKAIAEFMAEVEDNDNLLVSGGDEYDFDQVSIAKIYDESTVAVDKNRNGDIVTVSFEIKLKYSDKDTNIKSYETFAVEVVFEDGEKPVLSY